jgi:hypothetical protein
MPYLKRRHFVTLLGGAAVSWPRRGWAQQAGMPVVGYLRSAPFVGAEHLVTGSAFGGPGFFCAIASGAQTAEAASSWQFRSRKTGICRWAAVVCKDSVKIRNNRRVLNAHLSILNEARALSKRGQHPMGEA